MKKRLLFYLMIPFLAMLMAGCDLLNTDKEVTDPEKTLGKVGNYWTLSAQGHTGSEITIISNTDGNFVATLPYGGKTIQVEGKITDKGIYDYVYSNGDKKKPFTLVKFDAEVGDQWEYNVGNQKVVRKVVRKSTTDDTDYIFWLIKTIDVEETIPTGTIINGSESQVKKILWKFNHKFGFVSATVTESDNSVTQVTSMTNAAEMD